MKKSNTHNDKLKFSQHARIRQAQRNITDSSVSAVMHSGAQIDCKDATIYTDQNTKVVFSSDSHTGHRQVKRDIAILRRILP